jgi:hypothetical protein
MNLIVIIGSVLIIVGTILMVNNWIKFFKKLIEIFWPEWKEIERAITYLKNKKFLTLYEKEIFIPFQGYFCKKVRKKGIYEFKLEDPHIKFHGINRTPQSNFGSGIIWDEFVKEFYEEKDSFFKSIESKIVKIGIMLTIIGIILTTIVSLS